MKYLILGGGQLANSMVDFLESKEISYMSLTRRELDITDTHQSRKVILGLRPEVVINAAAWTNVDAAEDSEAEVFSINAYGAQSLGRISAETGCTLVQISTDYVFSGIPQAPWRETDAISPINVYGHSKALGESLVISANSNSSYVVRTSWLYSHYGSNFVRTVAKIAITEKRSMKVVFDQIGQPTFTSDLAAHLNTMIEGRIEPGIYHMTNSGFTSWYDLAVRVFELCGVDSKRIEPVTSDQYKAKAQRPNYSILDNSKLESVGIGPMRDWSEALEEAIPKIISSIIG
jgi:dTDP-4-dehydrorhamnose reductase